RRELPAGRFLRSDKARRHVGDPLDCLGVEVVFLGILDKHQDIVVLWRPFRLRARAVVIGPNDFVQEAVAPEDRVQKYLAVVHLSVIDVEVQGARSLEDSLKFSEPRLQKIEVIIIDVQVSGLPNPDRSVTLALEAGPISLLVAHRSDAT